MKLKSIIFLITLFNAHSAMATTLNVEDDIETPARMELVEPASSLTHYGEKTNNPNAIQLAGPRIGMVYLIGDIPKRLQSGGIPVLTQIGWQFENYFFQDESGWTGISEYVLMIAGMEREILLPSASWLVGIRSPTGIEIGIGPTPSMATMAQGIADDEFTADNISGLGAVVAAGMTFKAGRVNFPVNVAIVKSGESHRFVLSCGFNLQDS